MSVPMDTKAPTTLAKSLSPVHVGALALGCIVGWIGFVAPGAEYLPEAELRPHLRDALRRRGAEVAEEEPQALLRRERREEVPRQQPRVAADAGALGDGGLVVEAERGGHGRDC